MAGPFDRAKLTSSSSASSSDRCSKRIEKNRLGRRRRIVNAAKCPLPKRNGSAEAGIPFSGLGEEGGRGRHFDSPNEAKLGQAQGVVNNHLRVGERGDS